MARKPVFEIKFFWQDIETGKQRLRSKTFRSSDDLSAFREAIAFLKEEIKKPWNGKKLFSLFQISRLDKQQNKREQLLPPFASTKAETHQNEE